MVAMVIIVFIINLMELSHQFIIAHLLIIIVNLHAIKVSLIHINN